MRRGVLPESPHALLLTATRRLHRSLSARRARPDEAQAHTETCMVNRKYLYIVLL